MLAEELIEAHEGARLVPQFTRTHPGLTPEEGYRAARALHEHRLQRGWRPIGRKIGFTNRTIWPRYGVYEPIWGTVYDRTAIVATENRAVVPLEGLVQPRIEPEICFRLRSAPKSAHPRALLESIGWVAHSVEIVQCHHPEWKLALADSTADNGLHGRIALGEERPISELPDLDSALARFEVALEKDGETIDCGTGANVLGSPLLALAYLVEGLARSGGRALEAGEIVSTGTLTDAHAVSAGETWRTRFSGLPLPGMEVRFR